MTFVVTENCIKCKYMDCVEVCPVDCFHEGPNMLVIDPDECIDCTLCEPECPAEAIFSEEELPDGQQDFRKLNADLAKQWPVITEKKDAPDDAKEWDADELLQSLKDGTESANIQRERQGIPSIVVTRWIEPPAYDNATHRLVWSAEIRLKHGDDPDPGVNYNTYVLGREGYVSLNLITSASSIGNDKSAAHDLLAAIQFNDGRRYTDFNSSTDKVAAYGLAALIGGIAAKKLGLLALLAATLAKFGKVIFVGAVLAGGALMKWLRSRSAKQNTSA